MENPRLKTRPELGRNLNLELHTVQQPTLQQALELGDPPVMRVSNPKTTAPSN